MEQPDFNFSDLPPAFDEWLRARPLQPGPQETSALLEKVRSDCHDRDFEEMLTKALRPDPTLYEPTMAARVRADIESSANAATTPSWFRWATPLAAAATLAVAFLGFRMEAPSSAGPTVPATAQSAPARSAEDENLTRIFALASNLQSDVDVSKVRSNEALAFLME